MASDVLTPFYLGKAQIRGKLVRLGAQLEFILKSHNYPPLINRYLSELIAIGAVLSLNPKMDGVFTLQISQGQILKMMVVDITSEGGIRACAKWDQTSFDNLLQETNGHPTLNQLFQGAFLVFTADLKGSPERYQAVVELSGTTLSDCMHHFFRQSDQLATGLVAVSNDEFEAAALILQRLPSTLDQTEVEGEKEDDDWLAALSFLGTVTKKELFDSTLSANDLLFRLFHEHQVHVLPEKNIVAYCHCSREKIEKMLANFSDTDKKDMVVDNKIEITCEFCNKTYTLSDFSEGEKPPKK